MCLVEANEDAEHYGNKMQLAIASCCCVQRPTNSLDSLLLAFHRTECKDSHVGKRFIICACIPTGMSVF